MEHLLLRCHVAPPGQRHPLGHVANSEEKLTRLVGQAERASLGLRFDEALRYWTERLHVACFQGGGQRKGLQAHHSHLVIRFQHARDVACKVQGAFAEILSFGFIPQVDFGQAESEQRKHRCNNKQRQPSLQRECRKKTPNAEKT